MKPPDTAKSHIVAAAALGALTEARRRSPDALSRESAEAAPNLLRGRAAELAFSAIGRDQLLRAALLEAAEDLEHDRAFRFDASLALPEPRPSEEERTQLRREVFAAGGIPTTDSRRVVEDLEVRYRSECSSQAEFAARLQEDANLHEAIWDDPRLSCGGRTRLVMLFSVPKLLERAEALEPPSPSRPLGAAARQTADPMAQWAFTLSPIG